jgi:hypothetical protein
MVQERRRAKREDGRRGNANENADANPFEQAAE